MTTRDAFKAAAYTALFTFIALFGLALLGWLNDVWGWAQDDTGVRLFPDPTVLIKAGVSATVAAIVGLVNFAVRWAQGRAGIGETPTYVKPPPA